MSKVINEDAAQDLVVAAFGVVRDLLTDQAATLGQLLKEEEEKFAALKKDRKSSLKRITPQDREKHIRDTATLSAMSDAFLQAAAILYEAQQRVAADDDKEPPEQKEQERAVEFYLPEHMVKD